MWEQSMSKTNLQLLTEKEAAKLLGMTPRFLQARRVRGNGPPVVRISSRAIRYRVSDLEGWVRDRLRTSTAED
jgi:predicted DNA-binding transcriptional regulator AlpA